MGRHFTQVQIGLLCRRDYLQSPVELSFYETNDFNTVRVVCLTNLTSVNLTSRSLWCSAVFDGECKFHFVYILSMSRCLVCGWSSLHIVVNTTCTTTNFHFSSKGSIDSISEEVWKGIFFSRSRELHGQCQKSIISKSTEAYSPQISKAEDEASIITLFFVRYNMLPC